jgi:hypothetical protein
VPGAELVLRAAALAPDPATTIVMNCAGRTRSIIGAQSLINARIPNKVMALENGTIAAWLGYPESSRSRFWPVDQRVRGNGAFHVDETGHLDSLAHDMGELTTLI